MLGFSLEGGSLDWYAKALGEGLYLRVFWNTFESMLTFLRDQVARPNIGHDAEEMSARSARPSGSQNCWRSRSERIW